MNVFLLLILLLASVIETTLILFPLTLIAVTVISVVWGIEMIWVVFLGGLLLDLLNIAPLGAHSLFFLMVLWLIHRYQKKIHMGVFIYPMFFILAATSLYSLIFYRYISYLVVGSATVLGMCLVWLMSRLFPERIAHKKRLTV